jgi:hypothetical protein
MLAVNSRTNRLYRNKTPPVQMNFSAYIRPHMTKKRYGEEEIEEEANIYPQYAARI